MSLLLRLRVAFDTRPPVLLADTETGSKIHQLVDPAPTGPGGFEKAYRNITVCGRQEFKWVRPQSRRGRVVGPWVNLLLPFTGRIARITCRSCLRIRRERKTVGVSFPYYLYPEESSDEYYARTTWTLPPGLTQ